MGQAGKNTIAVLYIIIYEQRLFQGHAGSIIERSPLANIFLHGAAKQGISFTMHLIIYHDRVNHQCEDCIFRFVFATNSCAECKLRFPTSRIACL